MTKDQNISNIFFAAAKKHPKNLAIIHKDGEISFEALEGQILATAAYFQKQGIQKGDRVLVFVPMGIELYRIVLALFYLGATAVFLDEWVSKERLEVCCRLADCKGFIGVWKARVFAFFSKPLRKIPIKLGLKKQGKGKTEMAAVDPDDTALITFTTGSTGIPKAADRTHAFLKEQFDALIDEIDPKEGDIDMPVLPIVLLVNLGVGCTSVVADFKMTKPDAMQADRIAEQIRKYKVNRITASPFFIKKMAEYAVNQKEPFLGIEKVFTGGAAVFPREAGLYLEGFPKADVKIVYGSTESEPISSIKALDLVNRKDDLQKGLPVGIPYHKIALKIIEKKEGAISVKTAAELDAMKVENGQIGEIIVAGPHVLKKYFKNELAFKENKIVIGETIWHRTGDSGCRIGDELFLTGRCKQLIGESGNYIAPFIVEYLLQEIEGIEMGTMLEKNGKLLLIMESKLLKEETEPLVKHIQYDEVEILSKIPRDPRHNSKIDYGKLKAIL